MGLYFGLCTAVDSKQMIYINICQLLDSNHGPLVLEADHSPN